MDRLRFATGRSVITAARQGAYEGYKGHGVLIYAILEALAQREGAADEVDLLQLAANIDLKVPESSQEMTSARILRSRAMSPSAAQSWSACQRRNRNSPTHSRKPCTERASAVPRIFSRSGSRPLVRKLENMLGCGP